ncbi:MAG: LOG family protein [Ignavibacteriae bacterium]|nr:MAG: LOG family protein [Ignavibacteriota bacterium]
MTQNQEKIVTIFGSGLTPENDDYFNEVVEIGKIIAKSGCTICCGGYAGTMQAICQGAKAESGKTIGITINTSNTAPNRYIDENVAMENWVERLMELIAIADVYLILKGGSGTLVEISAIFEMMNKKIMKEKKMLFISPFWNTVIETLKIDSDRMRDIIERNVYFINNKEDIAKHLT